MQDDREAKPKVRLQTLRCRRTGLMFSPEEHAICPYCSADAKTIAATGDPDQFCEYKAGIDPIHFGFPDDTSRRSG